jgi:hypothetical protein
MSYRKHVRRRNTLPVIAPETLDILRGTPFFSYWKDVNRVRYFRSIGHTPERHAAEILENRARCKVQLGKFMAIPWVDLKSTLVKHYGSIESVEVVLNMEHMEPLKKRVEEIDEYTLQLAGLAKDGGRPTGPEQEQEKKKQQVADSSAP